MPYALRGNSVIKKDSGEVVKTHPTREKALKHLKALKVNVESEEAVLCECGAPARGPVCQRGHRLQEAWSPQARAAAEAVREARKHVDAAAGGGGFWTQQGKHVDAATGHISAAAQALPKDAAAQAHLASARHSLAREATNLGDDDDTDKLMDTQGHLQAAANAVGAFKPRPAQMLKQRGQ